MKTFERKILARVPRWAAAVLLMLAVLMVTAGLGVQLSSADAQVAVAKASATEAKTEAASAKAELTQRNRALAEANERLRAVGEPPVDPDKPQPPVLTAPVVALAAYVTEWRNHG